MSKEALYLVAGLGNPGSQYRQTRHNVGFMLVDRLAAEYHFPQARERFHAAFSKGGIEGHAVLLAKPLDYMNASGPPLQQLAHYYRISGEKMIIVHDDIDLPLGRLKIKEKGGHGGHKGVRSLMEALGGGAFIRLRIGVGRGMAPSGSRINVTDHVLGRFKAEEQGHLDQILSRAQEALVTILSKGTTEGMNRFNNKNHLISR
jgi:PTH1 family peptidyl-tRNA hydrolase